MKFNKNKKGFTLVEEIASIAIISIVLVACLPMFASSYKNIISNGSRTKSTFEAQSNISNAVNNISTIGVDTIKFKTPSVDGSNLIPISIIGNTITSTSANNKTTLSTFVPN